MTINTPKHRKYALCLAIFWSWVIGGMFFACVCWPDALTTSDGDRPAQTLTIRGYGSHAGQASFTP